MLTLFTEIPSTTTAHATRNSWARIEFTKSMRKKGCLAAAAAMRQLPKGTFPLSCVSITLWISYPNCQQRDNQNILVAFKGFIDGMVDAGMIADDNNQVVVSIAARTLELNSPRPGVTVLIERAEAAPIVPKIKTKKVK